MKPDTLWAPVGLTVSRGDDDSNVRPIHGIARTEEQLDQAPV